MPMAEMARQVVQHDAPELSSFVHMTHTEQPELYLTGNAVLRSEVGLQQGLDSPWESIRDHASIWDSLPFFWFCRFYF